MKAMKIVLIGCGTVVGIFLILIVAFGIWIYSMPDCEGVRLSNNMEMYALEYLDEKKILDDSEELLAYYDKTMECDSSEAAILTTNRVIYHRLDRNNAIKLTEVEDILTRKGTLNSDVFEIIATSGKTMMIEIDPWNDGEVFKNILIRTWEKAKKQQ
jgi:hypothetical protein